MPKIPAGRINKIKINTAYTTASLKSENPNAVVVLGTNTDDGQVQFIAAVSDSLIQRGINAGEIIRNISALTGGKGGGRPNMAQGGGKDINKAQEALDAAVKMVREKLR